MSQKSTNLDLERLTVQPAEAIIFTIGSAIDDPKAAVMRLLRQYLEHAEVRAALAQ